MPHKLAEEEQSSGINIDSDLDLRIIVLSDHKGNPLKYIEIYYHNNMTFKDIFENSKNHLIQGMKEYLETAPTENQITDNEFQKFLDINCWKI